MEARLLKNKLDFKTTDGTISMVHDDGRVSNVKLFKKTFLNT